MFLEQLRDFEWLNEPENVSFSEDGMVVTAREGSDFWQNPRKNIHADSGHFFFVRKCGNFTMEVQWQFPPTCHLEQCGIMLRFDEKNWMKAAIMCSNAAVPKLGSCVTNSGYTDWAAQDIPAQVGSLSFRIKRQNGEYALFYSTDGENFKQIRLFSFVHEDVEIKAGAYICSPQADGFSATLKKIVFE